MAKPLAGIRVIELANFIAGPLAGTLLADMGADVIKVEPPKGDMARATPPNRNGESVSFVALNRNKRSMVLDLKHPAGAGDRAQAGGEVRRAAGGLPARRAGQDGARRQRPEGDQPEADLHLGVGLRPDRAGPPPRRRQPDHRGILRRAVGDRRARRDADAARRAVGRRVRRAVCDLRDARGAGRRGAPRRRPHRRRVAGRGVDRRGRLGGGRISRDRQGAAADGQQAPAHRALSVVRDQRQALRRDRHAERRAVHQAPADAEARRASRRSALRDLCQAQGQRGRAAAAGRYRRSRNGRPPTSKPR